MPSLDLYRSACAQLSILTKQVETLAHGDRTCRRFMTVPGVGPVVALAFMTAVDYPERFKSSADVGAYFGLTPRQFQSGQVDYQTGISKRGDPMVRRYLVGAATVLLTGTKKWCPLKAWGIRLAKKQGIARARVPLPVSLPFFCTACGSRAKTSAGKRCLNKNWRDLFSPERLLAASNRKGLCRDGRDGDRAWSGDAPTPWLHMKWARRRASYWRRHSA